MKGLIIIPTYNEVDALPETVEQIFSIFKDADVLIVDDDSPDGTSQMVQSLIERKVYGEQLLLLLRKNERGFASAYRAGWDYFKKGSWDYVQLMDADGSHPIALLPLFRKEMMNGSDLIIGSRYIPSGGYQDWPWYRVLLSFLGQIYIRLFLGVRFRDWTSGFIAIRRNLFHSIDYESFHSQGFSILVELKAAAAATNPNIQEIPIRFVNRTVGESKITKNIILEGLQLPIILRWRQFLRRLS